MANQPESKPDSQGYRRRPLLVGLQICSSRCHGARSGKRRDDSKQLKWLYVLSSSTVALDVDVAAAEWKKQENMCINLKNLNWFVFIGAPAGPSLGPGPGPGSALSPHFTNNSNCDSCHVL